MIPEKFENSDNTAGSFWEHNIALLRSHYPALAEELEGAEYSLPPISYSPFLIEQTPSGYSTLIYQENTGTQLNPTAISIHSRRDPFREGQRQAETALAEITPEETTEQIIILMGFGLGYTAESVVHMNSVQLNHAQKKRIVIIVERHKELFTLAMKSRNLDVLISPGTAMFILGGEPTAINAALSLTESQKPVVIKNRALTGLTTEDQSWYADVERRINTWASKEEINAATLQRFGKRWTRNLAANMDGVLKFPGVKNLENILNNTNIPVFLAAAGPSLNEVEHILKEIRLRCVIVAVDTSLRCLLKNGIEPDFIVSVDPQYWNAQHLHRLASPNAALIAESAVYPPVLRSACETVPALLPGSATFRRVFFCQSLFPLGRFIEDRTDPKGALGAGGSVATTAWDFARFLQPSAIWIAGLDLAFPGYRTHYRGALFEENTHNVSKRLYPAETHSMAALENGIPFIAASASGGKVLTDKRLSLYAAWFENRIEQGNLINHSLSPDGLAVQGLINSEIEELLSLPICREKTDQLIDKLYNVIDEQYAREEQSRNHRYSKALADLIRGLEEIRDNAHEAVQTIARTPFAVKSGAANRNSNENERILKKLDKANAAIAASPVKAAAGFLFPPLSKLEEELRETDPFKRHLEFSRLFYQSLYGSVEYTLSVIKKP